MEGNENLNRRWRVGVDSGGTFTDICLFDESTQQLHIWKVSSTPDDPSRAIAGGVEEGLAHASGAPARFQDINYFGHGTTVATNALIEHRGVSTGLITTSGFRDLLEIGRQRRPTLYDWRAEKPLPLVERNNRLEVTERTLYDGRVGKELDADEVRARVRQLKKANVRSIAICFLYSYVRPQHEMMVRDIVKEEYPEAFVSVSCEVAPEFREFERLSTVVVNAYLGPTVARYLKSLGDRLKALKLSVAPHLTQSNGGVISFETAQTFPVKTILSGPATGIVAALEIGKAAGISNMITFDMGGTSTDVALIEGGAPKFSSEANVHGYPIKTPMLEINTVGAGGGSIAHVDAGGLLKVGPRSAGAHPGPVCYESGNTEPTVTDANVVLQTLNPEYLLGGRMKISQAAAKEAIARLANRLGMGASETAQGIISVVTSTMAKTIRVISVQKGYDPRDFTLVAFGGAGPIHAARLARELDIRKVLVPKNPGVLCALGLLLTDLRTNQSLSQLSPLRDGAEVAIVQAFAALSKQAEVWFEQEKIAPAAREVRMSVDMRYAGQNYELNVNVAALVESELVATLHKEFEAVHRKRYGSISEGGRIEITTYRIEAIGITDKVRLPRHAPATGKASDAIVSHRKIYLPETGGMVSCPIYDREKLGYGHTIEGPAVIDQMDSTTLVLPGQIATVDELLNLMLEETK